MSVLVEQLKNGQPVIAAELRPPRAELATAASMDAWIDTYHAVRGLTRAGTFVFLTDSAVGMKEEDNLRHLVINLGSDVPRSHVVPFLTCKHTTEYCLAYADRARHNGFESLVILGGDKHVGPRPVRRARVAAARDDPRARVGAGARGMGQSALEPRGAGAAPARRSRHGGVLPDADRVAPQPCRPSSGSSRRPSAAAWRCPGCSAFSTTARRTRARWKRCASSCPSRSTSCARSSPRARRRTRSARDPSASSPPSGVRHFYVSNLPVGRAASTLARVLALV